MDNCRRPPNLKLFNRLCFDFFMFLMNFSAFSLFLILFSKIISQMMLKLGGNDSSGRVTQDCLLYRVAVAVGDLNFNELFNSVAD